MQLWFHAVSQFSYSAIGAKVSFQRPTKLRIGIFTPIGVHLHKAIKLPGVTIELMNQSRQAQLEQPLFEVLLVQLHQSRCLVWDTK